MDGRGSGARTLDEARPQVPRRREQLVGRGLAVAGELGVEGGAALRVVEVGEATEEAEPRAHGEPRLFRRRQRQVLVEQGDQAVAVGRQRTLELMAGSGDGSGSGATSGATVADVPSGTPADHAGIVAGDVITAVDGQTVASAENLTQLVGANHPGDKVKITRTDTSGKEHSATVTLASGPAQ